mmetsp:Transcript_19777/g.27602  ORF Transcript_19777/g.27602 Transcript_19777/m.27602 type:complete len:637 (+) Transcript_19777:181-2091(+)
MDSSQFIEFDEEFDVEDIASNLTEDDLMRIFGADPNQLAFQDPNSVFFAKQEQTNPFFDPFFQAQQQQLNNPGFAVNNNQQFYPQQNNVMYPQQQMHPQQQLYPGTPHSVISPPMSPMPAYGTQFQNQPQQKSQNSFQNASVAVPFSTQQTPTTGNIDIMQHIQQQILYHPPAVVQPYSQVLLDIQKYLIDQKDRIEKLYHNQQQLLLMPQPKVEIYNSLLEEHKNLKSQIDNEFQALHQLYDQFILEPPDLQRQNYLRQDLEVQRRQLDLLSQELSLLVQPVNPRPCLCSLVILKQPFPLVISKNKQLPEDQLQVQLITASNVAIASVSQVKASILSEVTQGKGSTSKPIDCHIQNLNPSTRIAKFPLKFNAGTKKASATLKFSMQLTLQGHSAPITIESNQSLPLVVITNECQWEGSAGTLLKKEAFSTGQLEITWARFANTLQYHFLRATRQELARPRRILTKYDLNFFHSKLENKPHIGQKDFEEFWDWFGKAVQKIRYQRHIGSLWQTGMLYGFMGRDEVNAALKDQEPGTFILRFSERHAGQFAIAYIGHEHPPRIKHYLVQPNDTAAAKKTLPDFLEEHRQFLYILILTIDAHGRPTFIRVPKEQALEPYVGKKQQTAVPEDDSGYDPL